MALRTLLRYTPDFALRSARDSTRRRFGASLRNIGFAHAANIVNLLIVDDHPGMRELIRELIGELASHTRECASGEEAIALCKRFVPDCVTMDLTMNGMHGLAAIQHIRGLHPTTHIIVVTQHDNDTLRVRAQRAGADQYLTKDNLESLHRSVAALASED